MSNESPDWLTRIADALDLSPPSAEEIDLLLDTTRIVAHGTERKLGPLTTYLIGVHVSRGGTLKTATQRVRQAVPQAD